MDGRNSTTSTTDFESTFKQSHLSHQRHSLPPQWVDTADEISDHLREIQYSLSELTQAQNMQLKFDESDYTVE